MRAGTGPKTLPPQKATHQLSELPALLIRGEGSFTPDEFEESILKEYLATGGLLLFEASSNESGQQFLNAARLKIKELLPASATLKDIGGDKELMGTEAGKASVQAFKLANQSLAAAFLSVASSDKSKGLPRSTAARAIYNMMFQKMDPMILQQNYPISLTEEQTPEEAE